MSVSLHFLKYFFNKTPFTVKLFDLGEIGEPKMLVLSHSQLMLSSVFFRVIDQMILKRPKKIKSFRSECLKIQAYEHCYGKF